MPNNTEFEEAAFVALALLFGVGVVVWLVVAIIT